MIYGIEIFKSRQDAETILPGHKKLIGKYSQVYKGIVDKVFVSQDDEIYARGDYEVVMGMHPPGDDTRFNHFLIWAKIDDRFVPAFGLEVV